MAASMGAVNGFAEELLENDHENLQIQEEDKPNSKDQRREVKKKLTPGVIYLSSIPPSMNVQRVRNTLSTYGEIDRIFLQPGKPSKSGKPSRHFTEGWVEFKSKKKAKAVASILNGQQVGGKRKHAWYDSLWSMKYLHRFQWTHLNERLAYEKAVRSQRVRTEIAQAKRESSYYSDIVEKTKRNKKKQKQNNNAMHKPFVYNQKRTAEEMAELQRSRNTSKSSLLSNIFGSGVGSESE